MNTYYYCEKCGGTRKTAYKFGNRRCVNCFTIINTEINAQYFTCTECNWHYKDSIGDLECVVCPECKKPSYPNKNRGNKMRVKVYNQEENEKVVNLGLRKVSGGVEVVIRDGHGNVKGKIFKFQDDGKICTYYACEEVQDLFQTDNNNRFRVSNF